MRFGFITMIVIDDDVVLADRAVTWPSWDSSELRVVKGILGGATIQEQGSGNPLFMT